MEQPCPICGYQKNPGGSIFCMQCGNRMEITATSTTNSQFKIPAIRRQRNSANTGDTGNNSPVAAEYNGYAGNTGYNPSPGGGTGNIAYNAPSLTGDTGNSWYNSPPGGNTGNIGYGAPVDSEYSPGNNQQQVQQEQNASTSSTEPAQMGSTSGSVPGSQLPRHAFAGRGSRVTHHSWLLEGEFANAAKLRSTVAKLLSQRCFRTLKLEMEKLYEHGYWPEEREYVVLQRGVTTVLLYVAPAGRDLYISRTTMAQPSFDPLRILLLIVALGGVFFVPSMLSNESLGLGLSFIFSILYLLATFFLATFLFSSFKHWIAEKDFWVYLRRNTWNDFEIDDVMLLEHATDDTVRAAVDLLKLDATKIVPPVTGYQPKHRIRLI